MKELINAFDNLPLIVKLILAIPALDIVWAIYRIVRALDEKDTVALIIAIILLFVPFMWLVDILCIALKGGIWCYHTAK